MEPLICDFCGSWTRPIQVHGHFQCGRCKKNLAECCSGEQAQQIPEDNHDEPIVSEPNLHHKIVSTKILIEWSDNPEMETCYYEMPSELLHLFDEWLAYIEDERNGGTR